MLFIELALIRWLGSEVLYLSFFSNFVLLASFLGIGLGFLRASSPNDLTRWAPVAVAFLVLLVLASPIQVQRPEGGVLFPGAFVTEGLPAWAVLPFIFVAVLVVNMLVAERVGRLFPEFSPLDAYRLDIIGAIAGITAFSLLSFTWAPPFAWGAVVVGGFLLLDVRGLRPVAAVAMVGMLVGLGHESLQPTLSWSPYYKVQLDPGHFEDGNLDDQLSVNGIPHQDIESVTGLQIHDPFHYHAAVYDHLTTTPQRVLIIGAGNGNDVAVALAHNVGHVDAVEIDPRIQQLGSQLHPDKPYSDPRVTVHIDDGRAFLERTDETFDLIVLALPDSLTLVSGQSSLRLESYLFTLEAMQAAHDHLNAGGTFVEYNFYHDHWLVDRLAVMLQQTYGHAPCIDEQPANAALAVLTVSVKPETLRCTATWSATGDLPSTITDDYPFLYLHDRTLPPLYLALIAGVLFAALVSVRLTGIRLKQLRPYLDLAFMGAAFLLLETRSVVTFALLFGTTWFVNALVFGGILVAVLAAIELSRAVNVKRPMYLYIPLLLALGVAWLVPPSALLTLAIPARFAAATALAFTPIFIANVVFAQRFRSVASSPTAFGANLIGAMVGGLAEYASLFIGYRSLLVIVALFYVAALISGRGAVAA